jgi:hypothetical protein
VAVEMLEIHNTQQVLLQQQILAVEAEVVQFLLEVVEELQLLAVMVVVV